MSEPKVRFLTDEEARSHAAALDAWLGKKLKEGEQLDLASIAPYLTLNFTVAMSAFMLGECRMATPYAPMRPVRGSDGKRRWCCTHDPEHCDP